MKRARQRAAGPVAATPWLLLVHQLQSKSPYLRVKIWRRLRALGAVSVKHSVYALPSSDQALEDFQWLLREIEQAGGEGMICEATLVDGLTDQEVRALFDAARDADYDEIAGALRALAGRKKAKAERTPERVAEVRTQLLRLRRRFGEVNAIDFFGATGRMTVEALLSELEARYAEQPAAEPADASMPLGSVSLLGKVWVTRRGVHVDRIACAWLIRRFIDPQARFKFVAVKDYAAQPGELRFDMFQGEFTHRGDKCSFEVLLERAGLGDPALHAVAQIVHDIDLKDGKFGREQTAGIAHVVAGICMTQKEDAQRIERGSAILDDTYEFFRRRRGL